MGKKKEPAFEPEAEADLKKRAGRIAALLAKDYAGKTMPLNFNSPFELLIATILAAQCTDARVNAVTPELFGHYPDPRALAGADVADVERIIRTTGFFHNKAKAIQAASRAIVERFGGRLPESIEDLTALPGVGRKTAHVVRGNALGLPAIFVDTHVIRVSGRLALTASADPARIETDIARLVPENTWTSFCNHMTWHGRSVCVARNPRCAECILNRDCPTGRRLLPSD
ncbi:MAG: endonuclease III [Candidatus Sumerlaeia bacterium]